MLLLKIVTTVKRIELQMLYMRKEFNDYQDNNNDSQHIDETACVRDGRNDGLTEEAERPISCERQDDQLKHGKLLIRRTDATPPEIRPGRSMVEIPAAPARLVQKLPGWFVPDRCLRWKKSAIFSCL